MNGVNRVAAKVVPATGAGMVVDGANLRLIDKSCLA